MQGSVNKAIQYTQHGNPSEVLNLVDAPLPGTVPAGYIRVNVKARPVNPADIFQIYGGYGPNGGEKSANIAKGLSQTAGSEGSGVVVAVGEGVENYKAGDRIYFISALASGAWTEYVDLAPETLMVPIPPQVDFETACQLFVNPITAMGFFETIVSDGLPASDLVVFTGASSALVKMILRLRKLLQLKWRCVCVVRTQSHVAALKELGAEAVLVATDEDRWENVRDSLRNTEKELQGRVRIVFDAVGGGPVTRGCMMTLPANGTLYIYGALTRLPLDIQPAELIFHCFRVTGWWLSVWAQKVGFNVVKKELGTVLQLLATKQLEFPYETFDLTTHWKEALTALNTPGREKKVVLVSK